MYVDKAENDCSKDADTQECKDDEDLLIIDIISIKFTTIKRHILYLSTTQLRYISKKMCEEIIDQQISELTNRLTVKSNSYVFHGYYK